MNEKQTSEYLRAHYILFAFLQLHKYWHKNYMLPDESNSLKIICITMESYYIVTQM